MTAGRMSKGSAEQFIEIGVVSEAGLNACLCPGFSLSCIFSGQLQPFMIDILIDGIAGVLFKASAEMTFGNIKMSGNIVQRQRLLKVTVDIENDVFDLLILKGGFFFLDADMV